jgi:enoyl-CoA hydratase/carnithine racemase
METPSQTPLLASAADGVLTLTLNRPDARNALSDVLLRMLQLAFEEAADNDSVRVIVLAANGSAFSAGHDLKEMTAHRADADKGLAFYRATFLQCSRLMQGIVRHPKPVIASVQGIATAAGCQLAASCDLALASSTARFATPGVDIGLFCSTPMVALSRSVARKPALEMLLTGKPIDAAEALRIGLINRVTTPEALHSETLALARLLASKPVATVRMGKQAFQHQIELSLSSAYDYVAEVMTQNMLHTEAAEGIGAFLEKRPPHWPET